MQASLRPAGILRSDRAWRYAVVLLTLAALAAMAWPSASAWAYASSLRRYPYVSEVVGNSATVNWATDRSQSAGTVTWGVVTNGLCTPSSPVTATKVAIAVGSMSEYQWTASLLFPGPGTYCYRIQLGGADLLAADPSPQVKTAAAPGSSFSFAVLGDWGAGTADEANVMSRIGTSPASFVVSTGDNEQNAGSETQYGDLTQGNVFPPQYLPKVGSRPFFAAEGNHGFTVNLPYLQNFPAPTATQTSGGRHSQESYCCISTQSGAQNYPSSWYAFNWGSARFYVLEAAWADNQGGYLAHWNGPVSGCGPCGAELQWLRADLAANAGTPVKFAFLHYPLHADSSSQGSDTYLDGPSGLEGLLANNNVGIAFNGHAHQYERNYPQIPGKPLVSYVTGGGGAQLGSISGCSAFDAYALGSGSSCRAPKPASNANVFEFLLVTVNGGQVTVTPTDSTGRTFDEQTYTFATGPSAPDTVIDSAPSGFTASTSATVAFHSSPVGATFTCRFDGAADTACTSPISYTGLAAGPHTFAVAASTSSGTDPTPAVAGWTVDTSPPSTPTDLTEAAASIDEVDLSWTGSSDNTGVAGYDISRDGTPIASTSGPATTYRDSTVAPSTTYRYAVAARDGAGNTSPVSTTFSVTTPAGSAAPALVQTAGSSTTTVTFPTPTTPGDLLVLSSGVFTGTSKPITAVNDGKNTWTRVGAYAVSGANSDGELWYAPNAASVGSVTVTTGATTVALRLQEFSGVATTSPLDRSTGAAASSRTATSGQVTPTTPGDLAVGFIAGHANTEVIASTTPGYAMQPQQTTTSPSATSVASGYQVLGAVGAQTFSGSFPVAMYWAAGLALFKSASPPAPNDFSLAAVPGSLTVAAGSATTATISTAVTSGGAQSVALSATGAPAGTTVSFNPSSINSGQGATMIVTTLTSTPAGTSPVTVTGTGASAVHSTPVSLTVTNGSTPLLVQSTGATESSAATSLTGTFPSTTTPGGLLVLSASEYTGATNHITAVTDSAGNTWALIGAFDVAGHYSNGEMWYSTNAASARTVTVHMASAASIAFGVQEFSGIATTNPLDVSAGSSSTGTAASSGSAALTVPNELAVGFIAGHGNIQPISVTTPGYAVQPQQTTTGTVTTVTTGYQLLGAPSTQSFSGTFASAMYWAAGIAFFRPAS